MLVPNRVALIGFPWIGAILAGCWISQAGWAQTVSPPKDGKVEQLQEVIQAELETMRKRAGWPGATAAIVLPDGQTLQIAAGVTDRDADTAMPVDGQMLVGSTGKLLVSTIALQLTGEGKLGLDDPVSRWLGQEPWFAAVPNADSMTVRQLMNHSSGLPRYIFVPEFLESIQSDPGRQWTVAQRMELLDGLEPVHPAGEGWAYSDTNYILLGAILEKVTGQTFYELADARLIQPLELRHTVPSDTPRLPDLVPGLLQQIHGMLQYLHIPVL